MKRRGRMLGLLMAVTAALTVWTYAHDDSEELAAPAVRKTDARPHAGLKQQASLRQNTPPSGRPTWAPAKQDPFGLPAPPPAPPPPVAVAPEPPPKPQMPPLPYRYFGRIQDPQGQNIVYLVRDEVLIPVRVGTILDQLYQIEQADDTEIVLTYLPLKERVTLAVPQSSKQALESGPAMN